MSKQKVATFLCLALSIIVARTEACGYSFTLGTTMCVKLDGYYGYQWATCLTDSYIKIKSSTQHRCRNYWYFTRCWYQCMLEKYGRDNGLVNSGCSCNPAPTAPPTTLPSWCYSPPGDSCSWYKDCLEKRFQCSGTKYDYAIGYGTKFCELYDQYKHYFSESGKKWVDGVRKCLQVELVPYIRQYERQRSCKEIKDLAMDSHKCCYTAGSTCSSPDTPSICDIPCMDWLRVAWTIKDAFVDETVETFSGIWHVLRQCSVTSMAYTCTSQLANYMKFLTMDLIIRPFRQRRSTDTLNIDKEKIASDLSKSISTQLKWDANKVDWFVYAGSDTSTGENLEINFVLVDKNIRDQQQQLKNSLLLDDLVNKMMSEIESGNVRFASQSEGADIQINTLSVCDGMKCEGNLSTITAPVITTTTSTRQPTSSSTVSPSATPVSGKRGAGSRITVQYFSLFLPFIFFGAIW